jgi:transposase-like protein
MAESFAPGASVSTVAQRYGVNANLLFTWRRQEVRAASCSPSSHNRRAIGLIKQKIGKPQQVAAPNPC